MAEDSREEQGDGRKVHPRWTDNPFRSPDTPPEQLEWLNKRDEALRIYRETGDDSMAIEIGLFPTPEEEAKARGQLELSLDSDVAEQADD